MRFLVGVLALLLVGLLIVAAQSIARIWRTVREWKVRFEEYQVPADQIEKIAPAFRHIDDVATQVSGQKRVEAFIERVLTERGVRVSKADIWRTAGYADKSVFAEFQQDRAGRIPTRKFNEVLALEPEAFLRRAHLPKMDKR